MKKLAFALLLTCTVTAHAGIFDFFDLSKFFEAAVTASEGIADNLEKVRLAEMKVLDIREQWDQACVITNSIQPSILVLNKVLTDAKVNLKVCAPITTVIKLNSDILAHCADFYTKPVPDNAEFLLGKFAIAVFQTKLLLNKCNPELAKLIKLPGAQ